jgi:glycosyltransferase involved in cell wall biosynthesis
VANVCFEGFVAPHALATYYRKADAFLTTSGHEGYCLPLLEAMHHRVPVIAHGVGGMPEALDGAGVRYDEMDPSELAVLMHLVLDRGGMRDEILASQDKRMKAVRSRDAAEELMALLSDVVPG